MAYRNWSSDRGACHFAQIWADLCFIENWLGSASCQIGPINHFCSFKVGMCLKENYLDLPSSEYSRHYSAESEYLQRQNMNSKLGEEQKKGHHVRRSPNFDSNLDIKQKKVKMIMV